MMKSLGPWIVICCALLAGCDTQRISKLEKENAELKAKLEKQSAAENFELQGKCSKDARTWFNASVSREKTTIFLDFANHYNEKRNKCFILVEHHFNSTSVLGIKEGTSWTNDETLTDVYENEKYAEFMENHITRWKPAITNDEEVIACEVQGQKCKTADEFNNLTGPYMND